VLSGIAGGLIAMIVF